jgi:hypothetical protein
MSFLDPLLGAIAYGAEVTQLGAIGYGAEVRATLTQPKRLWRRAQLYNHKARLAELVQRKALTLWSWVQTPR